MSGRLHVVAGVLRNARGELLLAQRPPGRELAGRWEFPGGKVEPGESPQQALRRELHEELGIEADGFEPLIAVPHDRAGGRLRLDAWQVASFRGEARGREGQTLAWVAPAQLYDWPMPPADLPVVAALLQPDHYLVTPEPGADLESFLSRLQRALDTGIARVQLRVRVLQAQRYERLVSQAARLCRTHGAQLLLNAAHPQAVALARDFGLGLHLPSRLLGQRFEGVDLLAASCHDAGELQRAGQSGADFAVLGPVMTTPTHPEATGTGWSGFEALRASTVLPVYALGGVSMRDLAQARRHGAQGIAAIRAFWPESPES